MKISEAAKASGYSIETLRYYDKLALVSPAKKGKDRDYTEDDVSRLIMIGLLKSANFSLEEIRELFVLDEKYDTEEAIFKMDRKDYDKVLAMLKEKEFAVSEQLKSLRQAQKLIRKMKAKITTLEDKI